MLPMHVRDCRNRRHHSLPTHRMSPCALTSASKLSAGEVYHVERSGAAGDAALVLFEREVVHAE